MTVQRIAVMSAFAITASIAIGYVLRRSRHRSSPTPIRRDMEWDLADDITQAVANALPHESGAFNIPPSSTQEGASRREDCQPSV